MNNGDVHFNWTVIDAVPLKQGKRYYIVAKCLCGKIATVNVDNLKSGKSKSCGCLRIKAITKHNYFGTRTYQIWQGMKQRCTCATSPHYARYGACGIYMDSEWQTFENFLRDMGECPVGMQLDRIQNNGPYTKANCRWVTPSENLRNRTMTNMYKGQPTFLHEVAADMGVSTTTLYKLRKEFQNLTLDELTHIPK